MNTVNFKIGGTEYTLHLDTEDKGEFNNHYLVTGKRGAKGVLIAWHDHHNFRVVGIQKLHNFHSNHFRAALGPELVAELSKGVAV